MFKLIKFIFKLIGILMLILALLPIIALVIMYKGYTAPVEDFEAAPNTSFTSVLVERLDSFLEDDDAEDFSFTLTSSEVNASLKAMYAADNPNFGLTDENIPEKERKYAIAFGDNGGFKGATLSFYDGGMTIEAGIDAGFSNIYYQTTLFIDLTVEIISVEIDGQLQSQYKLTIKGISFGNLPILWMYDFASWVFSLATNQDLNTYIQNLVADFGNFDLNTKSVWVNTDDLINLISSEDDSNRPMIEALFGFLDEEELLNTTFEDGSGGIALALGRMRSSKTPYVLTEQIQDETQLESFFTGQLTTLLLSSLSGTETLKFNMHEQAFNQLLDYYVGDSMHITEELEFEGEIYELTTQPIYAILNDGKVHFTVILTLSKQGEPTKVFQTDFTLHATPSVSANGQDLVFTIDSIGLGDDLEVSSHRVEVVLSLIGESELIDGNQIILKDFLGEFASQGVSVEDIFVQNKYLVFELLPEGSLNTVLAELQDAIADALDEILVDPAYSNLQEVFDEFINDPENTDINAILDAMNELDLEDQEVLFNELLEALDGIENLEDLLP